jgi:MFS family permease
LITSIKQYSPQVLILWVTYFLWSTVQGFVWPFLNLYIYQTSQGDIILTALITAIPSFATIFSVSFWGYCIDRFSNNKFFALLGLFSAALVYFLGIFITDAFLFFILYSIMSFFFNAFIPASQSYASLQGGQSGQSFGNLFAFASMGWFFGVIVSGVLFDILGMIILFQIAFVVLIIAGILSMKGYKREKRGVFTKSSKNNTSSWITIIKNPVILSICIVGFFYYLFATIANAYFSIYVKEIGGSSFIVGSALAVTTLLGTIMLPYFGRWSEKFGRKPFIIFSIGGLGVVGVIAYLIPHPVVVGYVWGGIPFYPGILTGAFAMISDASSKQDRGKAMGLFNGITYFGQALGPLVGALIIIQFNMGTIFLVAGILELFLVIYVIFFLKESEKFSSEKEERVFSRN